MNVPQNLNRKFLKIRAFRVKGANTVMMAFRIEGWATWEMFRNTGKPTQPLRVLLCGTTAGIYCKGLPGTKDLLPLVIPAGAGSIIITYREAAIVSHPPFSSLCPPSLVSLPSLLCSFPFLNICGTSLGFYFSPGTPEVGKYNGK